MKPTTGHIALCPLAAVAVRAPEAGAEGSWDIPKGPSKCHIFIFMGQSNMAGGFKESHLYNGKGDYEPVTDPVPRVLLRQGRGWKPAAHPLTKHAERDYRSSDGKRDQGTRLRVRRRGACPRGVLSIP